MGVGVCWVWRVAWVASPLLLGTAACCVSTYLPARTQTPLGPLPPSPACPACPALPLPATATAARRSHKDLAKDAAPYYRKAKKFYDAIAAQLVAQGHSMDLFACSLDQVRARAPALLLRRPPPCAHLCSCCVARRCLPPLLPEPGKVAWVAGCLPAGLPG